MRLCTSWIGSDTRILARRSVDEQLYDLTLTDPSLGRSVDDLLHSSDGLRRAARALERAVGVGQPTIDPYAAHYAPLISRAGKFLCLGLNYAEHAEETQLKSYQDYPEVFARFSNGVVGQGSSLQRPPVSEQYDYEAELAVVIGRTVSKTDESEALHAVAGYSIFNDGTVRDFQFRTSQWTLGKNFDQSSALGPELVTPEELPPGAFGLRIRTRVNGETLQDSNTSLMIFTVPRTIALLSQVMTLLPGDVLAMGTPSGVGFTRQPPRYLKPGDEVEIEIERIGILKNRVEDWQKP